MNYNWINTLLVIFTIFSLSLNNYLILDSIYKWIHQLYFLNFQILACSNTNINYFRHLKLTYSNYRHLISMSINNICHPSDIFKIRYLSTNFNAWLKHIYYSKFMTCLQLEYILSLAIRNRWIRSWLWVPHIMQRRRRTHKFHMADHGEEDLSNKKVFVSETAADLISSGKISLGTNHPKGLQDHAKAWI